LLAGIRNATHAQLQSTVYLDKTDALNSATEYAAETIGAVSLLRQTSSKVQLTVTNASTAILVAANLYNPLWKAIVDGQPARIFPADEAFQAINLPAGSHQVEFNYQPPYSFKH